MTLSPNPTFLFYDLETTGRNHCFDQAIQFAAIRTTLDFKELERVELQIRLNPDVIPSPEACLVHRVGIDQMLEGTPELTAARQIHRLCNTPGTISLGYNTLGFDDEFLRFTFYRNLLTPYTHQFKQGCSRMDLYPITVLYALFHPEALEWPKLDGRISLKLEHLSKANQLATGPAHQAIVDVQATVALAKRLAQQQETWDYVMGYFDKRTDLARLSKLPYSFHVGNQSHQEGLMVSGNLGHAAQFMAPVVFLGTHFHYKNQSIWLRLDDPSLEPTTPHEQVFTLKKKAAEPPFILPPKTHYLEKLSAERRARIEHTRAWLREDPAWFQALRQHHLNYTYPEVPETDANAALYQADFLSDQDQRILDKFHLAEGAKGVTHLKALRNPHYQSLGERLIGRDFPTLVADDALNHYQRYLQQIITGTQPPIDYRREPHLTPQVALTRCQDLLQQTQDPEAQHLLQALSQYLQRLIKPTA